MTPMALKFLLAAASLTDDELSHLQTMMECVVEDEKDDIRQVAENFRHPGMGTMSAEQLAEAHEDAAAELTSIQIRVALARKLLKTWEVT